MRSTSLRHRITVQSKVSAVDQTTGYVTTTWVDRVTNEPAAWLPGPGREYLAAESVRASVSGRFTIRSFEATRAIQPGDRVLWDGRVMEVAAPPLPDETARRELILMVSESGTDGS